MPGFSVTVEFNCLRFGKCNRHCPAADAQPMLWTCLFFRVWLTYVLLSL